MAYSPNFAGQYGSMEHYAAAQAAVQQNDRMRLAALTAVAPGSAISINGPSNKSSQSSGATSAGNFVIPTGGVGGGSVPSANEASYDPWSRYRAAAGDQLANSNAAGDPSDIYKQKLAAMSTGTFSPDDPSYRFRYDQGLQATERSLAAKGLLNSGNAAIELQNYGQKAASQEYGAQFSRMLEGLNGVSNQYDKQQQRLMEMAGIGLDPTGGAKVGIAQTSNNIDAMKANQSYDLGSRGLLQQSQQMYAGGNSNAASILSNWL